MRKQLFEYGEDEENRNIPSFYGYRGRPEEPERPKNYVLDNDRARITLLSDDETFRVYARLVMNTYGNGSPNGSRWVFYTLKGNQRYDIMPERAWKKADILAYIKRNMAGNFSKAIEQLKK